MQEMLVYDPGYSDVPLWFATALSGKFQVTTSSYVMTSSFDIPSISQTIISFHSLEH
jgi:hypothetical protein